MDTDPLKSFDTWSLGDVEKGIDPCRNNNLIEPLLLTSLDVNDPLLALLVSGNALDACVKPYPVAKPEMIAVISEIRANSRARAISGTSYDYKYQSREGSGGQKPMTYWEWEVCEAALDQRAD